jgi:hypothetical protein
MNRLSGAGLSALALLVPLAAEAHGIVGKRFLPATMVIDDPFVADEASLPTLSTQSESATDESPKTRETEIEAEFAKRLTPHFGISLGQSWVYRQPEGGPAARGFSNLEVGARYQFLALPAQETVASFDLGFDLGGTGARRVEADRFSAVTPSLLFGKGFGDLPDGLALLRPLAVTGLVGGTVPFSRKSRQYNVDASTGDIDIETERHPSTLNYGFTLQYSLAYLQANVRNVGLGEFARRLVPVVEFAFETPLDAPGAPTTGSINPGLLWTGRQIQLGIEAIIPVNAASGANVGVRAQLHLYLDDILGHGLGAPLFGG